MKLWEKNDLEGRWDITVKLDGVNATWDGEKFISRKNKPLHNVNHLEELLVPEKGEVYEVFCGSFKKSNSLTRRSKNNSELVTEFEMFDLEPEIDPRLYLCALQDPTFEEIDSVFQAILRGGYEGLVLRGPNGERLKVKDKITLDLIVIDITEGTGRNAGRVGALVTSKGKVSGMSDWLRWEFWEHGGANIIGKMIEVECMELTEYGNMRHARFIRIRDDKLMEEADG